MSRTCRSCKVEVPEPRDNCPNCGNNRFNIGVTLLPAEMRVTNNLGYWGLASRLLDVAIHLENEYPKKAFLISHRLVAESLELGFKAFLCARNASRKSRKEIGHDLIHALDQCKSDGLDQYCIFDANEISTLETINGFYKSRKLFYWDDLAESDLNLPYLMVTGFKSFPSAKDWIAIADKLINSIRRYYL